MDSGTWQVNSDSDCASRRKVTDYFAVPGGEFFAGKYNSSYYEYGAGARFTEVTIPAGATITSAILRLVARENDSGTICRTRIHGQASDNPNTFSTKVDFDGRSLTTSYVNWDSIPSWTLNSTYESPDISTIIQEIINRPGWVSGNSIVIFWDDFDNRSDDNGIRDAYTYSGSHAYAPQLSIIWSIPSPPPSTPSGVVHKGWQAKIKMSGIEVGICRSVSVDFESSVEVYYEIENPIMRLIYTQDQSGTIKVSGSMKMAWINPYYLNLLIQRNADGSLPSNTSFDLVLKAANVDAPEIFLYNCRFTKGSISIPANGWLEEEYDFISLGIPDTRQIPADLVEVEPVDWSYFKRFGEVWFWDPDLGNGGGYITNYLVSFPDPGYAQGGGYFTRAL